MKSPLVLALMLLGCSDPKPDPGDGTSDTDVDLDTDIDADVDPVVPPTNCVEAAGSGSTGTSEWIDGSERGSVTVTGEVCSREFVLSTTGSLRDDIPSNPRTVNEQAGWPSIHTHNDMFDALHALAIEEVRENSVDAIHDAAFNGGAPLDCPPGGCFETGMKWTYVWTRDTAYAVDLALAAMDPTRARNSLQFKLSELRGGGDLQIVQDTGTGGSYPVSSDRVVWAMGASQLLNYLDGTERDDFADLAFEAMSNTVEHDRVVVYDPDRGLYRGEQSFLDWREQSYPGWTAENTVHQAMSQTLSTNIGHLRILEATADLADERGDETLRSRYQGWADELRSAIDTTLWHEDLGLYSTFITTFLDPAPTRQHDLLGSAFAVLYDVADATRAGRVVESYPHCAPGPPVIWPQQKDVPIYHNRGIWPFATAYWLRAARRVRNDAVVDHDVRSMIRGAALNLSNMENFEAVSGAAYLDDGAASGPVVNSTRQLWSVAGYLSMVHDVMFGLEASPAGIRFDPYVPRSLRTDLFAGADEIVLNNFPYRGRTITVVVSLPTDPGGVGGAYIVGERRLNGAVIDDGFIATTGMEDHNVLEIDLVIGTETGRSMNLVTETDEYRNLFGPFSPEISDVSISVGRLQVSFTGGGEPASEITFSIYRDGEQVATDLAGSTTLWADPSTSADSPSHCYSVEASFVASGNTSQHSPPWCYWGPGSERVSTIMAGDFVAVGGTYVDNHGRFHYENWGDEGHSLTVNGFAPDFTGEHLLQVVHGNGAGPLSTGVTCAVKWILIEEEGSGTVVGSGLLVMPHLGDWTRWEESNFVPVDLRSDRTYTITILGDDTSINMSALAHFETYGFTGGTDGVFNRVNIAELKVLSLTATP